MQPVVGRESPIDTEVKHLPLPPCLPYPCAEYALVKNTRLPYQCVAFACAVSVGTLPALLLQCSLAAWSTAAAVVLPCSLPVVLAAAPAWLPVLLNCSQLLCPLTASLSRSCWVLLQCVAGRAAARLEQALVGAGGTRALMHTIY
jgi:hypothetical protein